MTSDLCVYCAARPASTRDHVPARSLYMEPLPAMLRTVPSCSTCNGGAAKDDEYLRDVVLKHQAVADLPQAQGQVQAMLRAAKRPKARKYLERTLATFRRVDLRMPSGLIIPDQVAYVVDGDRIGRVIERYVRGLYWLDTGHRLPDHLAIRVVPNPERVVAFQDEVERLLGGPEPTTVQESVFWYTWRRAADNPDSTIWLLVFFDEFAVMAFTFDRIRLAQHAV